jgi:predicted ATPase
MNLVVEVVVKSLLVSLAIFAWVGQAWALESQLDLEESDSPASSMCHKYLEKGRQWKNKTVSTGATRSSATVHYSQSHFSEQERREGFRSAALGRIQQTLMNPALFGYAFMLALPLWGDVFLPQAAHGLFPFAAAPAPVVPLNAALANGPRQRMWQSVRFWASSFFIVGPATALGFIGSSLWGIGVDLKLYVFAQEDVEKYLPAWMRATSSALDPRVEFFATRAHFERLEEEKKLASDVRLKVRDLLAELSEKLFGAKSTQTLDHGSVLKTLDRVQRLLLLPTSPVRVELTDEVNSQLQELLHRYNPEVKQEFLRLAKDIAVRSQKPGTRNSANIFYLQGEAGTGKSYLLENFTDLLKVPLINIALAQDGAFKLFGECAAGFKEDTRNSPLALIAQELTNIPSDRRGNNGFIVFDRVDEALLDASQSAMLGSLLATMVSTQAVKLCDFGLENYDLSDWTIVFVGRGDMSRNNALRGHFKSIHVGDFEEEGRKELACEFLGRYLSASIEKPLQDDEAQKMPTPKASQQFLTEEQAQQVLAVGAIDGQMSSGVLALQRTMQEFARSLRDTNPIENLAQYHSREVEKIWDPRIVLRKLQREFALIKDRIPLARQKKIKTYLNHYEQDLFVRASRAAESKESGKDDDLRKMALTIQRLVKIPFEKKRINIKEVKPRLEEMLQHYPKEVATHLKSMAQHHAAKSLSEKDLETQSVVYFYGPYGTGKTHAVMKLGEALGVPVVIIRASDIRPDRPLFSFNHGQQGPLSVFTSDIVDFGSPDQRLPLNAIIFFDEMDTYFQLQESAQLKMQFLQIFDPTLEAFPLPELQDSVPAGGFMVVLAGNKNLLSQEHADEKQDALVNRFAMVPFLDFSVESKAAIALAELKKRISPELHEADTAQKVKGWAEAVNAAGKIGVGMRALNRCIDAYSVFLKSRAPQEPQEVFMSPHCYYGEKSEDKES